MRYAVRLFAVACLMIAALLPAAAQEKLAQEKSLTIFAAASLKNALDDVNAAYTAKTGVKVAASYAASSALAKQLEQGAPADLFASADIEWMEYATQKKSIKDGTRVDLLGNKLVLIAPKDSSTASVQSVPASISPRLPATAGSRPATSPRCRSENTPRRRWKSLVRGTPHKASSPWRKTCAALTLVARKEAVLGIVYETDARVEPGVKVIATFPQDAYAPVIYPFALTATARPETANYLAFIRSSASKAIFEKYGFTMLLPPSS